MLKQVILAGVAVFFFRGVLIAAELPVPCLIAPAVDAKTIIFHSSFSWELTAADDRSVCIQIAADEEFKTILDEDKIHSIVNWYVPAKRLPAGTCWWRVRTETDGGEKGEWSLARSFSVVEPNQTFLISPETSLDEMRRIGEKAASSPSARIQFTPGTYRLKPGFEEAVFDWKGAENIILDGGGSRFIMEEPSAQLWKAEMCRNILIGNFSYEYDPRPHTISTVLDMDSDEGWLDVEIVDGFSGVRYPRTVNQFFCYALDPKDNRRLHPDRPGHIFLDPDKTVKTGENRLRYFVRDRVEFSLLMKMKPGDRIVACFRRWSISYVKQCVDFTLFNIQVSKSESSLFMGGGNEDMKFLNLTSESEKKMYPSPAGWVTGNDRHGPWIEGCSWEALADDGPNITGNLYLIEEKLTANSLLVSTGPYWQNPVWKIGDRLLFWNPQTGEPVQETTLTGVSTSAKELVDGSRRIQIADDLYRSVQPGGDMLKNTQVYNLSSQNNGFVARNNKLICGRRFGFNVKAFNALIEKNYFEGLASCAVYIENEPMGWEGIVGRNIVVQDNRMVECGDSVDSARRRRASGVHINLWRIPSPTGSETRWKGHKNILIRRNTMVNWESVGIGVDNATNVRIEDNHFESGGKFGFLLDENFGVLVGPNTSGIEIGENEFSDERRFKKIQRD
jgi:hypothetical protein